MRKIMFVFVLLSFATISIEANATKKHGFVVGIQEFTELGQQAQLNNPVRDAEAVFDALRAAGFDLVSDNNNRPLRNLTLSQFELKWKEFLSRIEEGDWAFVYISSHGHGIADRNYILPKDAPFSNFRTRGTYSRHLISIDDMAILLKDKGPSVSFVVIDACRDDPFIPAEYRKSSSPRRSSTVAPTLRPGMLQLYSAQPGHYAYDSLPSERSKDVTHSLFARFFIPAMNQYGQPLGPLIDDVLRSVYETAKQAGIHQYPNVNDSLPGWRSLCLRECRPSSGHLATDPGKQSPQVEQAPLIVTRQIIREAQELLYELNYDIGEIDGLMGEKTRQAILAFEIDAKFLQNNGRLTLATLEALRRADSLAPWGAIAYSDNSNNWGTSWKHKSRKDAVEAALKACGESNCNTHFGFFGSDCAAFAYSGTTWSIAADGNLADARITALTQCKTEGKSCNIVAALCADGKNATDNN